MRSFRACLAISCLAFPLAAQAAAPGGSVLTFTQALGGGVIAPVQVAQYVYVVSGAIITAYDYTNITRPVLTGATNGSPARGVIAGLARGGDFLYAGWSTIAGAGGVAVYSIADRAHPKLIGQYSDYTEAKSRAVQAIAVASKHLYLFDGNNGVFVSDLANPVHPAFVSTPLTYYNYQFQEPFVKNGRIYMSGRDFIDDTTLQIYGTSTPLAPTLLGSASLDGFANFRLKMAPPYAIGFGAEVTVTDVSNPEQIVSRGSIASPVETDGFVVGNYAYGVGCVGVDIFNIANPDAPVAAGHVGIDSFATDATMRLGSGALLLTGTDQIMDLDATDPASPRRVSAVPIAGGVAAKDIALVGSQALILQEAYGFSVADGASLAPLGRFDAKLPQSVQARDFEEMAVGGTRAYLAAWGHGVIVADISNPLKAVELGELRYFGASAIDEAGDYAYIGRQTNGGEFVVVDVSDPAVPVRRASLTMSAVTRIKVSGNTAFVADNSTGGGVGGLKMIDITNPVKPVQIGLYKGCPQANDLVLDSASNLAYLACANGVHIVDVSDVRNPVGRGVYGRPSQTIALIGARAFAGNERGFDEIDVSDPANPVLVQHYALPYSPLALRATADARLFAFDGPAGLYTYQAGGS
jgi:hypothetical protein